MTITSSLGQTLSQLKKLLPVGSSVTLAAARRHPPILPFLLAYMSGLCVFFPATRHFIAPGLFPFGLFLFALFLTHRKTRELSRESIIVLFLVVLGTLTPALPDFTRPSNHILNHIQEGRTTPVQGKLFSSPRVLADRTYYLLELESLGTTPVTGTVRADVECRQVSGRLIAMSRHSMSI